MVLYLLTICKPQKKEFVDVTELQGIMAFLYTEEVYFFDYVYEMHGVYRQLHAHCIVNIPPRTMYSTKLFGFRLWWSKIKSGDTPKVKRYLHKIVKNSYIQEQLIQENYYKQYRMQR